MSFQLDELGTGQGYLKAGFLGFGKSGKSWTAVALAIWAWKFFGKKGRIVFYDTEGGSEYVAAMVKRHTGMTLLGKKTRSFKDLMALAGVLKTDDILIADSITHPWRELCDAYLVEVNAKRAKRNLPPRSKLEFQDWNPIKNEWGKWTDFYLNSAIHIIICGRAGFEYDMEKNEETGKKEVVKTGVKMKTETEFGFEPSLLVEFERGQTLGEKPEIVRIATVIGDRYNVMDGKQKEFRGGLPEAKAIEAVGEFFRPHLENLVPGSSTPIDTAVKTEIGVNDEGDAEYHAEKRRRTILCEEIQSEMVTAYPSQSTEHKQAKIALIKTVFNTGSWTKVESMDSDALQEGLKKMREILHGPQRTNRNPKSLLPEFQALKQRLLKFGTAGESEYRRILRAHGVEKSNQFEDYGQAEECLRAMEDSVKAIESMNQEVPA